MLLVFVLALAQNNTTYGANRLYPRGDYDLSGYIMWWLGNATLAAVTEVASEAISAIGNQPIIVAGNYQAGSQVRFRGPNDDLQ